MNELMDEKNAQAYEDCALHLPPSLPNDEEYMRLYRFWRGIAKFPEDLDNEAI